MAGAVEEDAQGLVQGLGPGSAPAGTVSNSGLIVSVVVVVGDGGGGNGPTTTPGESTVTYIPAPMTRNLAPFLGFEGS